jgi:hypothetical protein
VGEPFIGILGDGGAVRRGFPLPLTDRSFNSLETPISVAWTLPSVKKPLVPSNPAISIAAALHYREAGCRRFGPRANPAGGDGSRSCWHAAPEETGVETGPHLLVVFGTNTSCVACFDPKL